MATTNQNVTSQPENDLVDFKDLFSICLSQWYWFLLSVLITVGVAVVYVLKTPPQYTRTAEILIKDNSKGNSIQGAQAFEDLSILTSNSKVQNELVILRSPVLLLEVAKRLHLDMQYQMDGDFHKQLLYGTDLPISVVVSGAAADNSSAFTVQVSNNNVYISDVTNSQEKFEKQKFTGTIGEKITTPIGDVVVSKTAMCTDDELPAIYVKHWNNNDVLEKFSSKLTVERVDKNTDVLVLSFVDESVQRAEDVLNTLIVVYNESWVDDKNQITISTSMFIDDRLSIIESELGMVDNDISSFKSEHLVADVDAASHMYMQQSNESNQQLQDLQMQLSMAHYVKNYMSNSTNKFRLLPSNTGLTNASIESQIREYNEKLLLRNNLIASSSERNPLVLDYDEAISALWNAIVISVDNQLMTLNAKIRSIQKRENQTNEQMAANPDHAKYLLSVERQQKIKESIYLFLLQKREENELSQAFTAYNTRVITPPSGSIKPTSPVKKKVFLIALALGLLFPLGIIYLKISTFNYIRGRKDVDKLPIPFAGEIPFVKTKGKAADMLVSVGKGKRDMVNEAFRILRTNVDYMGRNQSTVMAVTSFNPGSGKSYISMNLAISLAILGKKVVVIDGDFRRASLSKYVELPRHGITNYIAGQFDTIEPLLCPFQDYSNLFVLPVGAIPPNPTELVSDEKFGHVIQQLKSQFDYVIIDCPPIDIIADAQIIESYVDRTLFVVRVGLLDRSRLEDLTIIYEENRFKNMSLVLNGSKEGLGTYGYHYGYGYGYGEKYYKK